MDLCIKDKCKRCDVGYIIKDYITPLMQALSVHLSEYNMRLIETKCLNTAVMMMYLFFGPNSLKHTQYCDVHNVVERHKNGQDNNRQIVKQLSKDILRKTNKRYVYYIMLTDGYFVKPDGSKVFFPGHVFLIEKIPSDNEVYYYIYQSYINEYTFQEYIEINKTIKVSQKKLEYYLSCISHMVNHRVWNEGFVKFWKDMTKVDTKHMLDSVADEAFYVCYQKVLHKNCVSELIKFCTFVLKHLPKSATKQNEIFGDHIDYHEKSVPLTNAEMRTLIEALNKKLKLAIIAK